MNLPADVVEWIRDVFRQGNERIALKLSNNPNLPEESLDLSWIEHLSQHSAPVTLGSDWTVQVETHFLGGMRHWHRWEIADIGLLLFAQLGRGQTLNKATLLQSKRLYPEVGGVEEETRSDYEIGFARLADPEILARAINLDQDFRFSEASKFRAIKAGSDQVKRISEYQNATGLKVYYQLYNPWTVPFHQRIPLRGANPPTDPLSYGVRVLSANSLHALLESKPEHYSPTLQDCLAVADVPGEPGWRLENFVADEWLGCREGNAFDSVRDVPIEGLFFRRTGAISAAISIRVQAPGAA
jgi:hypothetical protein